MNIKAHSLAAVPLAAGVYLSGKSAGFALGAALCSIFIDLDHIPEYLAWHKFRFRIKDFYAKKQGHVTPYLCYPLHSWDLWLVMVFLLAWHGSAPWTWALVLGWAYHLVWDQISNPVGPAFYLITYRALKGFTRKNLWGYWGIRCHFSPLKRGRGWQEE